MGISIYRIDDRLIHGQIVTAWLSDSGASRIIVADDKAAKDEFQQTLLKMATPKQVTLDILMVDEAITLLKEAMPEEKILLLTRSTAEAAKLVSEGIAITSINVGNLNMKKTKKKILDNFWIDEQDIENIKYLASQNIELEHRTVPTDRKQKVLDLIEKF